MSGPEDYSDLLEAASSPEARTDVEELIKGLAELRAGVGCECPRGWPTVRPKEERRPGVRTVVHHADCPLRT